MKTPEEILQEMEADEAESQEDSTQLPGITKIKIDVRGTRGKRYQGEFIYRVPRLMDQVRIGRLKSEYLPQGGMADPNAALLVEQMCYLAVTIQEPKPEWWEPGEFYDAAPMSELYKGALDYERRFHGGLTDDTEVRSGAEPHGVQESAGSEAASDAAVGRKVQLAAKRRETVVAHTERSG